MEFVIVCVWLWNSESKFEEENVTLCWLSMLNLTGKIDVETRREVNISCPVAVNK